MDESSEMNQDSRRAAGKAANRDGLAAVAIMVVTALLIAVIVIQIV